MQFFCMNERTRTIDSDERMNVMERLVELDEILYHCTLWTDTGPRSLSVHDYWIPEV